MKPAVLLIGLCLLATLAVAPVEAHVAYCQIDNFTCVTRCERDHLTTAAPHECYYYSAA